MRTEARSDCLLSPLESHDASRTRAGGERLASLNGQANFFRFCGGGRGRGEAKSSRKAREGFTGMGGDTHTIGKRIETKLTYKKGTLHDENERK